MKPKTISYGRTFCHNYQSYRADIQVELEDWETDLNASFDKLRDMVHDQIGKQTSDFTDEDRVEYAPLRSHVRRLNSKARQLQNKIDDLESVLKSLREYKVFPVLNSINDLLVVLKACGVADISDSQYSALVEARDNFWLALGPFDGNKDNDKDDDEDVENDDGNVEDGDGDVEKIPY